MATYLGMTKHELNDIFIYDKDNGKVYSRLTNVPVGTMTTSGLVFKRRIKNKVISISLGKMCYFLNTEEELDRYDLIEYVDGNYDNLRPDNLKVVRKVMSREYSYLNRHKVVPVDRFIVFNPNTNQYVVRRGVNQAIYRCFDLNEAISIRNEWELDNSVHKWDSFSGKFRKYLE